jgi:hypothetical protein
LLKAVIVVLILGLIASLGSGFYYLMIDQGDKTKRRTFNSLGVRVSLAVTLMALIVYGVATGQLGRATPWDPGPGISELAPPASQPG